MENNISDYIKRDPNIEILRIISMIFVLMVHYNYPLNGKLGLELYEESYWRFLGVATINSIDFVCVNGFIIISGYFGIKWKLKGIIKLLFQIGFWGGLIYMICFLLRIHSFNVMEFIKHSTCFLFGVNWFFIAYLGLYLIAPVLNAFVKNTTEKELGLFLIVFYAFQTLFGWITSESREFISGMSYVSFAGLYLLGAYLRKSTLNCFHWGPIFNLSVYVGVGIFCLAISVLAAFMSINKTIYSYISPLQILQTIYLFLFCKSLKIRHGGRYIIFFSTSAFAALLMHSWDDGSLLYYSGLYWIDNNVPLPFFASMMYIVLFFMTACCIDKARLWCWKNGLEKLFSK